MKPKGDLERTPHPPHPPLPTNYVSREGGVGGVGGSKRSPLAIHPSGRKARSVEEDRFQPGYPVPHGHPPAEQARATGGAPGRGPTPPYPPFPPEK